MTTIYIDILFGFNFIINYMILLITARIAGGLIRRGRLAVAALAGAFYAVLMFFPKVSFLFSLGAKLAASVIIVLIAFGLREKRKLLRQTLLFFAVSFALAGAMLAVYTFAGGSLSLQNGVPYIPVSFKTLVIAAAVTYLAGGIALRGTAERRFCRKRDYVLTISFENREIAVKALLDTGCQVRDPMTGKPVLVVNADTMADLFGNDLRDIFIKAAGKPSADSLLILSYFPQGSRFRLIPYRTVDRSGGLMLTFRPDAILTDQGKKLQALIGISPTAISEAHGYAALIGMAEGLS